jgi:cation diffusion facilitator CzcD-associated flavoprotein CzcO
MARRLQQAGIDDFILIERGPDVGGAWRDNIYPGCACDVRSHLYSFSFALNPDWTRRYAPSGEIQAYILRCVEEWNLRPRIRFGANLARTSFDEESATWTLECTDGRRFVAPFQVNAVGGLKDAKFPGVPGLGSFEGPSMHSSQWKPDLDLRGKRVGVVGTGASAIQIVPEIAGVAKHVTVFQRTPAWVFPRGDRPIPMWRRKLYGVVPALLRVVRAIEWFTYESKYPMVFGPRPIARRAAEYLARRLVRRIVKDPATAQSLLPSYALGCKRALVSDYWYQAFNRDDVSLCAGPIDRIEPTGVRADGALHACDVLIWCTGFEVDRPLGETRVTGLGGRDLEEQWDGRPKAHLGITVPGFPNSFLLLGPNTGLGHNSVLLMAEPQMDYIVQAIQWVMADPSRRWVDVRTQALDTFIAEIDRKTGDQVWMTGCRSWYLNDAGENFVIWPGSTPAYRWRTRRFDPRLHRSAAG